MRVTSRPNRLVTGSENPHRRGCTPTASSVRPPSATTKSSSTCRLAFDEARGRPSVICLACARWNLTPFEDRWETIEHCERRFRGTQVRVSTSNIGLAKMPEGLELVRIGKPLRPEFTAWRYGQQFLRRHNRRLIRRVAAVVGTPGLVALGPALAMLAGPIPPLLLSAGALGAIYHLMRWPDLSVPLGGGLRATNCPKSRRPPARPG